MLSKLAAIYWANAERKVFLFASLFLLVFIVTATVIGNLALMIFPFGLFIGILALLNYKYLYFLFLFIIPFTIEIHLPNGLGTDLPAEPLMVLFTLIFGLRFIIDFKELDFRYFKHPISLLLLLHLAWILISAVTAENSIISIKYFLAKLWYIIPFYFFPIYIFKEKKDYKIFFWLLFTAIIICVFYVILNHALIGFTFKDVNKAVKPFFRNKVNYAALIVILLPFVTAALGWYKKMSLKWCLLIVGLILFLIAIYFTYTRAAILSIFIAIGAYYIIRFKMIKWALIASAVLLVISLNKILVNNEYMYFAPDYEKTVTHTKFNNLVEATAKGQDVSIMERVYRWLAGYYMVRERPLTGFGPGNFYHSYKSYTVNKFRTYVSNNPDKSGIHCYYLMILVEQGILGFLILVSLFTVLLLKGESVYHRLKDTFYKHIAMAATVSLTVIMSILLINDMLETVKVGSIFFLCASFIMMLDVKGESSEFSKLI